MAGRRPTIKESEWESLLVFFRDHPGDFAGASRLIGRSRSFAKRAYFEGWPAVPWATPIARVIQDEHQDALVLAAKQLGTVNDPAVREAMAREYAVHLKGSQLKAAAHASDGMAVTLEGLEDLSEKIKRMVDQVGEVLADAEVPVFRDDPAPIDGDWKGWRSAEEKRSSFLKDRLKTIQAAHNIFSTAAKTVETTAKVAAIVTGSADNRIDHHHIIDEMTDDQALHTMQMASKHGRRLALKRVPVEEVKDDHVDPDKVEIIDAELA